MISDWLVSRWRGLCQQKVIYEQPRIAYIVPIIIIPHTYLYIPITGLPDLLKCLRTHTAQFVLAMKTGDLLDKNVGAEKGVKLADLKEMVEETGPDVRMLHLKQRMRNSSSIGDAAPVDMTNYHTG